MTNGTAYDTLTAEEQEEFRKIYNAHPLTEYIDWEKYYESPNGNALDFVRCIDRYTDDDNRTVFVLEELVEDDEDYYLIFVCAGRTPQEPHISRRQDADDQKWQEDNTFCKVPA